jgi:flagellar hook assembly protein FlgD
MLGQVVRTIVNEAQEAGYYSVQWDGRNNYGESVSSGVYAYRIQAGSFITSKKMNLIK